MNQALQKWAPLQKPTVPADEMKVRKDRILTLDSRTHDRRVQLVLILLEEDSQRQWDLADIAQRVNLSPGRLAHLFKREVGTSIQQYLTQIRLAKARNQLESTFLAIKEIAAAA